LGPLASAAGMYVRTSRRTVGRKGDDLNPETGKGPRWARTPARVLFSHLQREEFERAREKEGKEAGREKTKRD